MNTRANPIQNGTLEFIDLGLIDYERALEIQRSRLPQLIAGDVAEAVYICEHPATITHGRAADKNNLTTSAATLANLGVKVFEVERGGDCTWHGPGQIVVYPMLDLRKRRQDVGWYLRKLEDVIIQAIATYNITAQRICDLTGVWVEDRKIASIGVKLSRWCSMHGFSLNYANCTKGFALIRACGLPDLKVTSIIQEQPNLSNAELNYHQLSATLIDCFRHEFSSQENEAEKTSL